MTLPAAKLARHRSNETHEIDKISSTFERDSKHVINSNDTVAPRDGENTRKDDGELGDQSYVNSALAMRDQVQECIAGYVASKVYDYLLDSDKLSKEINLKGRADKSSKSKIYTAILSQAYEIALLNLQALQKDMQEKKCDSERSVVEKCPGEYLEENDRDQDEYVIAIGARQGTSEQLTGLGDCLMNQVDDKSESAMSGIMDEIKRDINSNDYDYAYQGWKFLSSNKSENKKERNLYTYAYQGRTKLSSCLGSDNLDEFDKHQDPNVSSGNSKSADSTKSIKIEVGDWKHCSMKHDEIKPEIEGDHVDVGHYLQGCGVTDNLMFRDGDDDYDDHVDGHNENAPFYPEKLTNWAIQQGHRRLIKSKYNREEDKVSITFNSYEEIENMPVENTMVENKQPSSCTDMHKLRYSICFLILVIVVLIATLTAFSVFSVFKCK